MSDLKTKQQSIGIKKQNTRKGLFYSIIEGSFANVMIAFGSNFIAAFAVRALNSNAFKNNLIVYLPPFLLAISQILSAHLSDKTGKRKSIVLICVLFQSVSWAAIFWTSYYLRSIEFLIVMYTLNVVIGYFGNAPWISWLGSLIPDRIRGKYIGKRNAYLYLAAFISSIAAGIILNTVSKNDVFLAFGILFHAAALARFLSFVFLYKQYEPEYNPPAEKIRMLSFKIFAKYKNYMRFLSFYSAFQFAVGFSSPLFIIYVLRVLNMSYLDLTVFNLAAIFSVFMFSSFFGKINDRYGSVKAFKVAVLPVFSVSLLWYLSGNFYVLLVSMLISGFSQAGIRVSERNVFYDNVKEEHRNKIYGTGTIFFTGGAVLGGVSGGLLADSYLTIKTVMLISTVLRLVLPLILFTPFIKEVKTSVSGVRTPAVYFRALPLFLWNGARVFIGKITGKK